jgi:hypothetical protein
MVHQLDKFRQASGFLAPSLLLLEAGHLCCPTSALVLFALQALLMERRRGRKQTRDDFVQPIFQRPRAPSAHCVRTPVPIHV